MKYKFKNYLKIIVPTILLFGVISCELKELDINTDPNSASEASLSLLLTNAEYEGLSTFGGNTNGTGLNDAAMGFQAINTTYDDFNFTNSDWNIIWNSLYSGPLKDLDELLKASDAELTPKYMGIAQILKAYYFTTMVDLWGDIPYSEAFKGNASEANLEPAYDSGASIYADAFKLIDEAIANLGKDQAVDVQGDILYGGSASKWIKAANSLKLRLLIQTRNVQDNKNAIQALIDADNLISSASDDFQLRYSALKNPENRHPMYQAGYAGGEAGYSYFSSQLMFEMLSNNDPRTPFYFKRQTTTVLDPDDPTAKQTIPCSQRDDCLYGYFVANPNITNELFGVDPENLSDSQAAYLAGYFGRDRSDPSGIPNDNPIRTTVGAYPAAGLFDVSAGTTGGNDKGVGDGIFPIITSWMVKFYMLEAQISLGVTTGSTEVELLAAALEEQLSKVIAVGTAADTNAEADISKWPDTYTWPITYKTFIADVIATYPTGGSESQRLNAVLKQAWFANFGNGYEGYNAFRRTGFPNDIQAPLQLPRQYALSLPYALDEVNLNSNTPDKVYDSPSSAIFWDTIKFQF